MKSSISPQDHARVLAEGLDIPQQQPSFALPLPEVGICGKTVWVRLPEGLIPFTARLEVNLAAQVRGIHMSRMEEVIAALYDKDFADLREYGLQLGREMMSRQGANSGRVRLAGQLPLIRTAKVSGRQSMDSIAVNLDLKLVGQGEELESVAMFGVGVAHITACPCTQAYNQTLFHKEGGGCPLPTHSQRSQTTLSLQSTGFSPSIGELLACLEAALHVTQDLLKRTDEAQLVYTSHSQPQFAEDAVREVARQAGERFGKILPPEILVVIDSLSLESIHIHDVCCRLETTLAEIVRYL
ncbi:MAG: GTP cyclohydrolase, FolE2/MptA family [Deltaproteobacteria bacterium]|nr:GTP cyclohydrolase, FolE2/MptA family [Deltaproteobacteria bacterium]